MPESILDNIELRSEDVKDILTAPPHWMLRWGNLLFLALIILMLIISWFVKYPDIISTQAILTTLIPPQKIIAKTSGKFEDILISNNDTVSKNQVLAVLENTAKYEDVLYLKNIIDTTTINYKSFQFPIENLPILFLGSIESDFAYFENAYMQYELHKKLKPFDIQIIANQKSIEELHSQLKQLENQKEIQNKELSFRKKDLERQKALYDRGVIAQQEYEKHEIAFLQTERNYKNLSNSISQLKSSISSAKSSSIGTKINLTKENITLLKNVIQAFHKLKDKIEAWELQYVLKSDINGVVSFLNFWDKNQAIQQGNLVFTIIPNVDNKYIARLKAPAYNTGKIMVGQVVNLKLNNYPETEFGVLKGKITNISLIPDNEGFLIIEVSLPQNLVTSYNRPITFLQEMTGTGDIITEDLRLLQRFFHQFRDLMQR